jgi:regulator of sigma E protease
MFLVGFDPGFIAQSAIPFVVVLVALVVVHEFGHFFAAKAFGIKVLEFGIGMPPRIKGLSWRRGETEYTINWLPIGGFVRLLGEEDPSDPRSLAAAPRWQRLTVMFAGVFMNLIAAIVLLSINFMIPGERALSLAQVVEVAVGSPAAEAVVTGEMQDGTKPLQGLQPGDIIMEVAGREVRNTSELIMANRLNLGKTNTWTINRQGSLLEAEVFARWQPPANQGPTGIRVGAPSRCIQFAEDGTCEPGRIEYLYPYTESVSYAPWTAVWKSVQQLRDISILTKNQIQVWVGGGGGGANDGQPAFQGPVGIAQTTGDIIEAAGWRSLIELAALLSLNLAIFNVLPLPMLDGGRIFFVFVEILRGGRRIAPEKEAMVHFAGFLLLMCGVLAVTYFDIARIVS